jgi:NADPH2:quinone reductase
VKEVTAGRGVDVLFDSVGAALFETSLKIIRRKGLFVNYGANSGPIPAIDPMRLANSGSLYFVRPRLADHVLTRQELVDRSTSLFQLWSKGIVKKSIDKVYELGGAADAHAHLEGRNSIGKSILSISGPEQSSRGNTS